MEKTNWYSCITNLIPVVPSELTAKERTVWGTKELLIKCIGGLPENVDEIIITEVFHRSSKTEGQFRSLERKIVLHRVVLNSVFEFSTVLLHEIAHARSGEGDVSEGFEDELTSMLGILGQEIVRLCKKNNTKTQQLLPNSNTIPIHVDLKCRCVHCGDAKFETNEDRTYAKCKICGWEYNGGHKELIKLNREFIMKNGLSSYKSEIAKQLSTVHNDGERDEERDEKWNEERNEERNVE